MRIGLLLSGGVDSLMSAYLLQQAGHEVVGFTMHNWSPQVLESASEAAAWLHIEHNLVDLREEFSQQVVDYFVSAYAEGSTPNPCVLCNAKIKFGALLSAALALGCDKVASGHYARVRFNEERGLYELYRGLDRRKDQSYFLCRLQQEQLRRLVFPLGEWEKSRVQTEALALGMPAARAPESQEICFIDGDYRDFLRTRLAAVPGTVYSLDGKELGKHRGLPFYTRGQRKGLGISAGEPLYVVRLDVRQNRVILGKNRDLMTKRAYAAQPAFLEAVDWQEPRAVRAQVRYRSPAAPAQVRQLDDGILQIDFQSAQRAVTPGQTIAFYDGDRLLGGAILQESPDFL